MQFLHFNKSNCLPRKPFIKISVLFTRGTSSAMYKRSLDYIDTNKNRLKIYIFAIIFEHSKEETLNELNFFLIFHQWK